MRATCFCLVLGALALAGCGDDDGVPAGDAGGLPDSGGGLRDSGGVPPCDACMPPFDATLPSLDAGPLPDVDAGPDHDAGPVCSETTMGSCQAGLDCIGCPSGPIMEHYLCTTSCTSDTDCTDATRPHCNLPGMLGGGGPGLCTAPKYACTWGAVCASPDTPIATPDGERPIASLREGDLVYSANHGALVPVPLARVASTPVFAHHVMRIRLASGRTVEMSPGHPTADGRFFGALRAGDSLDGVLVQSSDLVPFGFERTHDILPASDTGTYVAAGVLVGSTLAR